MFVQNLLSTEFSQEHFNPTAQGPKTSLRGWRVGVLVAAAKAARSSESPTAAGDVCQICHWLVVTGTWMDDVSIQLGISSSSQLTNWYFFRGVAKNHQVISLFRMQLVLFWWLCPNISPISWDMTGKIHGWVNPTSHWENAGWIGISSLVIPPGVAKPLVFTIPVSKHDGGIRKIVPSSR